MLFANKIFILSLFYLIAIHTRLTSVWFWEFYAATDNN